MNASAALFLIGLAAGAFLHRAEAAGISLASVPQRVAAANPELRAARLMIEEVRGRHLEAGRLMNPEIELSGRHMTEGKEGGWSVGLMQKFPVTARLRFEKAVTAAQIAAAEAEVADKRRMLVAEAESMAVKILSMRAQIRIAESQAALADKMAELAAARAAANESAIEATQMQFEARQARTSIRRMQAEIAGMTESLKPMIGLDANSSLEVVGALPEARSPTTQHPADDRPDIQAALHRAAAAGQSVNLAKAKKWADLSGGIMVDRARTMDMPEGLENETMVGVRLSIPLPFWNKNQGEMAEASAMRARAVIRRMPDGRLRAAKTVTTRRRPRFKATVATHSPRRKTQGQTS